MQPITNVTEILAANNVNSQTIKNIQNSDNNFMKIFEEALNKVEDAEKQTNTSSESLLDKSIKDLHTVIIDAEKAELTLSLALQVRNKIIDAYNEVMRMQI